MQEPPGLGCTSGYHPVIKAKGYQFVTVSEILNMPSASGTIHTVKAGDTLYSLAGKYEVTVNQIVKANNLVNANVIQIGQRLSIPGIRRILRLPRRELYSESRGHTLQHC